MEPNTEKLREKIKGGFENAITTQRVGRKIKLELN